MGLPKPDKYQKEILRFINAGEGNLVVSANPGSGKTVTLRMIAERLNKPALFLAFNKHVERELSDKLRGARVVVKTVHSCGFAGVRQAYPGVQLERNKSYKIARTLFYKLKDTNQIGDTPFTQTEVQKISEQKPISTLMQIMDLVRVNLTDPKDATALRDLLYHYDMYVDDVEWRWMQRAVPHAIDISRDQSVSTIDFTDMIYLPAVDPNVRMTAFDVVLVDEAQDLSAAQLEVVMKSVKPGGRVVGVGDPHQAIYGFCGAQTDSIKQMVERTGATVLPLSICYRCPSSHVELAASIVPDIEAAPGADLGEIHHVSVEDVSDLAEPGDLIICRLTAPVVRLAYQLLRDGTPAKIRGRQLGKSLIKIINQIADQAEYSWNNFGLFADKWLHDEIAGILLANGGNADDDKIIARTEQVECVLSLASMPGLSSTQELIEHLDRMFSDDDSWRGVWLSTIHRAKGLEADSVFLLQPEIMPLQRAKQAWQLQQEYNLMFVAFTRAKRTLYLVEGESAV